MKGRNSQSFAARAGASFVAWLVLPAALFGCSADHGQVPSVDWERAVPIPAAGVSRPLSAPAEIATPTQAVRGAAMIEPEQALPDARVGAEPDPSQTGVSADSGLLGTPNEVGGSDQSSEPLLYAGAREVFVYEHPSLSARKLGYLRAGARVVRSREALGFERCPQGFFRVAPEGYVCASAGARLKAGDAVSELSDVRADRTALLPYVYARSRRAAPPLYVKLPSREEQSVVEPEAAQYRADVRPTLAALPVSPEPEWLALGRSLPTPFGHGYDRALVSSGRAVPDSAFAVMRVFEHNQRRFALTTDLLLVPLDRLEPVKPSTFHGISLELEGMALPVAFVMQRGAFLYTSSGGGDLSVARRLEYREAVPLGSRTQRHNGALFLETQTGDWIKDERLTRVDTPSVLPSAARAGKNWIYVSIGKQALIAYQGEHPLYVTLVSTGVDGLGDPETTRSTVRGQFLIHTKHVSMKMDSDEAGSEFDLSDVPYVEYFKDNYALHAAFWHDAFGYPHSHGCVNLAPLDARWLFHFSDPPVPSLWHGAFSLREGTLVDIEP